MQKSRVTVVCVTYNHEKYIAEALESIVKQRTDFAFTLLVGDDASTDSTAQIVASFAEKYPDIIVPVLRKENIGATRNSMDLYKRVQTEYVAICDGDDYWTDDHKLQKQVDFLDENPDYSIVFCKTKMIYENTPSKYEILPSREIKAIKNYPDKGFACAQDLLLEGSFSPPVAVMFRWCFLRGDFPEVLQSFLEKTRNDIYKYNERQIENERIFIKERNFLKERKLVYYIKRILFVSLLILVGIIYLIWKVS